METRTRTMIQFMLTSSNRRGDLMLYFQEKWACSEETVDTYSKRARAAIMANKDEDLRYQKSEALAQIDDIIFKSFKINDFKTALMGVKLKMDLLGLAEPKMLTVQAQTGEFTVEMGKRKTTIEMITDGS